MPIVFDFNNGVDGPTNLAFSGTTQTLSYTENGIDFTFSMAGLNGGALLGAAYVQIGGTNTGRNAFDLIDVDGIGPDTFHLTFGGSMVGTAGDQIVISAGTKTFSGSFRISVTHSTLGGTPAPQTLNGTGQAASFTGTFTGIKFTSLTPFGASGGFSSISVNSINCFLGDVLIATPDGQKEVQQLEVGDKLATADGRETTIQWIGKQHIDTRLAHPAKANPICITAGCIAPGVPSRDLRVSQDHAVEIDGTLFNAGALVNGTTIYQVAKMPMDGFHYFHIETDAHELLVAEGLAAESFIDYAGRDRFENGGESTTFITEMDLPRISSARLVPDHIRQRLAPVAIAAE